MKLTHKKIIISGPTIEEFSYQEKAVSYDFSVPTTTRKRERIVVVDEESKLRKVESRQRSLNRTNSHLRRLVQVNSWQWYKPNKEAYIPVFLTLTFKKNIQDIKKANLVFSKFIKRLNYKMNEGLDLLKYVVVIEFQKRGAIHYHTIFFNLEFIKKKELADLWGQGHVKIKAINNVNNTGAYMSKYMSKNFADQRLDHQKRYFPSRGLHKPIEVKDEYKATIISKLIPKEYIAKEKEFESAYNGKVKYTQYKLNKKDNLFKVIPNLKDLI